MSEEKIEIGNLKHEIKEIVENCVECGMCKSLCPVFSIMKEEIVSPRGKAIELKEEVYNEIVYKCSLCGACKIRCPLKLEIPDAIKKTRMILVEKGKETKENKEMIENVRKYGNPFGKEAGKGKKLYCC